jgi:hypothetical protein
MHSPIQCDSGGDAAGKAIDNVSDKYDAELHSDKFITSDLQKKILNALDGRSLTAQKLADEIGIDSSRLYEPGGIKELMQLGGVTNTRGKGHGYSRVDSAPPIF